jgi:hypothetical protein
VARQGTHPGRSRQRQARSLSASGYCYTLQSRHEGKIRTSDIDWEMQEGKKLAITAVMRKLIVTANALLRDQRKWGEYPA